MPRRSDGGGDGPKPVPKPEKGATRKGEPMEQDSPNIFNAGKKLEVERPEHGTFFVNIIFKLNNRVKNYFLYLYYFKQGWTFGLPARFSPTNLNFLTFLSCQNI